jgi:hypothetical protein
MKEYGEFPIEERIKQDGIILSLKVNYYPLGRSLRKRGRFLCASIPALRHLLPVL